MVRDRASHSFAVADSGTMIRKHGKFAQAHWKEDNLQSVARRMAVVSEHSLIILFSHSSNTVPTTLFFWRHLLSETRTRTNIFEINGSRTIPRHKRNKTGLETHSRNSTIVGFVLEKLCTDSPIQANHLCTCMYMWTMDLWTQNQTVAYKCKDTTEEYNPAKSLFMLR